MKTEIDQNWKNFFILLSAEKKPYMNWKHKKVEAEAEKALILKIPYSSNIIKTTHIVF